MTDHEQQAIESATLEIHSVAAISVDVAERVAEAALSSLKASGYQYIPEGFDVVLRRDSEKMNEGCLKPECFECFDCKRPYGDEFGFPDLIISDEKWKLIAPFDSNGLLCPSCICARLHKAGLSDSGKFMSGPLFHSQANTDRWRHVPEGFALVPKETIQFY